MAAGGEAAAGTDAAPYFRIFNPTTQGERFDRDDGYPPVATGITRYHGKAIHEPWRWAEKAGVVLDYPRPGQWAQTGENRNAFRL